MQEPSPAPSGEGVAPTVTATAASAQAEKTASYAAAAPSASSASASANLSTPLGAIQKRGALATMIDRKEAERIERLAVALSDRAPPWATEYIKKAAPAIGWLLAAMEVAGPSVVKFYAVIYTWYKQLPKCAAKGLWGLCLCLFGGRYAVAIAAVEAFRHHGGKEVALYCRDLQEDFQKLAAANREDDSVDADNDGVEDVKQIDPKALLQRKVQLALRTIEPDRVMRACGGLWTGYMGMLVVLKFQFAKTVALAQSMADSLRPAASKALAPSLLAVCPQEYHQWVGPGLNVVCKTVTLAFAWKAQQILSTVQSATKGGLLASKSIIQFLHDEKYIDINHEDTMLDELFGWALAAFGIYYQLIRNDPVPLMLRPVFWPLGLLEAWLKWSVTYLVRDAPANAIKG